MRNSGFNERMCEMSECKKAVIQCPTGELEVLCKGNNIG